MSILKYNRELHERIPFLVDKFEVDRRVTFLSHFHADHYEGLWKHGKYTIVYCSEETAKLFRLACPGKRFKGEIRVFNDDTKNFCLNSVNFPIGGLDYNVNATVIKANHCYGSVMFFFEIRVEGEKSNVLFTGDFRFGDVSDYRYIGKSIYSKIDKLVLDNTFFNRHFDRFISRMAAADGLIEHMKKKIGWSNHTNERTTSKRIYLSADILGSELVIYKIHKAFNCRFIVQEDFFIRRMRIKQFERFNESGILKNCFYFVKKKNNDAEKLLKENFLHLYDRENLIRLAKKCKRYPNKSTNPVLYRLATIWSVMYSYNNNKYLNEILQEATPRQKDGIYYIPYSSHSSRSEICRFLCYLEDKNKINIPRDHKGIRDVIKSVCIRIDPNFKGNRIDLHLARNTEIELIQDRRRYREEINKYTISDNNPSFDFSSNNEGERDDDDSSDSDDEDFDDDEDSVSDNNYGRKPLRKSRNNNIGIDEDDEGMFDGVDDYDEEKENKHSRKRKNREEGIREFQHKYESRRKKMKARHYSNSNSFNTYY